MGAPSPDPGKRSRSSLFFRVVQVGQDLRVELWERGEFHGARTVSGSHAEGQLGARRVALAAAELARRWQRKRQLQAERERSEQAARQLARERAARRTLDGPLALRPSFEISDVGRGSATLLGPRLFGQFALTKRVRLDGGLGWLAGGAPDGARLEWLELALRPSVRLALGDALDLDLGVDMAAAWVRFARVRGVDTIPNQRETWSTRAAGSVRLEPRLSRQLRLSVGAEAGLVLRPLPFQPLSGGSDRLGGGWLGLDLGVVFTPG